MAPIDYQHSSRSVYVTMEIQGANEWQNMVREDITILIFPPTSSNQILENSEVAVVFNGYWPEFCKLTK